MLRIARVADRTGRYYLADLADLAAELRVTSAGAGGRSAGPGGRWLGDGAEGLGLCGPVRADALEAVLSGRHPAGHRLRLRETTVCAYDLTFAAPKSVSVLLALGDAGTAAAVRAAHDDAVDAAIGYVATRAAAVRHTSVQGRTTGAVGGLVAAAFGHQVSRALDPHLHSHVVVANLAQGDDGRWRAVDGRGLYAHAHAAGALYDAVLRHGVTTRAGLDWTRRSSGAWELSAVDPLVLGAMSARRAEILSHLRMHAGQGAPSRRARNVAWAATREPKGSVPSGAELRERWATIARDAGWSGELVIDRAAARAQGTEVDEHRFAAAIFCTEDRGVARRDALAAWAGSLRSGATGDDLTRCVDALADWGAGRGVAERRHPPAVVVPPPHVRRLLGPRPGAPEALAVWSEAATAIARYRARWGVRDPSRALGAATRGELATLPARRLADHLATSRAVDDALRRLGRTRDLERGRRLTVARGITRAT